MRRRKPPKRKAHVKYPPPPKRKKRKRNRRRVCPVHGAKLVHRHTANYGLLWKCPEAGCDVRCWGGLTCTPCDARTAAERGRTHGLFDPLWRGPDKRFEKRDGAYRWLAKVMGLSGAECHIGQFDFDQCRRAQAEIVELLKSD